MIKSPADSLRAAWGALYQTCAALRADKSIPPDALQIYLDKLDALQDDIAELSASIRKRPSPTADQSKGD